MSKEKKIQTTHLEILFKVISGEQLEYMNFFLSCAVIVIISHPQ